MELSDVIYGRKSIRAFKKDVVPKELVEKILNCAIHAPSNSNRQPWEFIVIGGEKLKKLNEELAKALQSSKPSKRELPTRDENWPTPKDGERRSALLMKGLMDSAREAGMEPSDFIKQNFCFFNAPLVILVLMEKGYGPGSLVSIGASIQNLLLSAYDSGLGTCWMMIPLEFGDVFRTLFEIPENKYLVSTIAVGYPLDSPINSFKSSRDPLEKFVKWFYE